MHDGVEQRPEEDHLPHQLATWESMFLPEIQVLCNYDQQPRA
jgi:hypothetical protein